MYSNVVLTMFTENYHSIPFIYELPNEDLEKSQELNIIV